MGNPDKIHARDIGSCDGSIYSVASGILGNAITRYIYFDLLRAGYLYASLQHLITATTITLEACNNQSKNGTILNGIATSTNGAGTTIVDSALVTAGFNTDKDLVGIQVRVVEDKTTPANIGLVRIVTDYVGATGTMTLATAIGATTSGVTKYRLEDNPLPFSRIVSDPPTTQWTDMTNLLFGVASATASGIWVIDTPNAIERFRIKAVTTNATNALNLRSSRGR